MIPFAPSLPTDKLGKDPSAIVAAYSHLLEVASYALVAAAGWLAHAQAGAGPIVTLDTAGSLLNLMLFAPLGVSVAAGSLAMLSSRLFPACWPGSGWSSERWSSAAGSSAPRPTTSIILVRHAPPCCGRAFSLCRGLR